jgi:hypothetical protein
MSLFQHDDIANEIILISQLTLDPNNITSPLAPSAPSPVSSIVQTMPGDIIPEGAPSKTEARMESAPEGASHESLVQLDHSPATVIPITSVDNALSASGQLKCNVGNYKQGPAKIPRLPIDGEHYDFSFSVISDWDQPVPVVANHANVQTKYHPQQRLHKSVLAECYLLQDCWVDDPECLHQIYSNNIVNSWESYDIYITDIPDPRLLAVCSSASKYNVDSLSWDTATIGSFQAEFWQAMCVELNTLVNKFRCWDLVSRLLHMNILPSTWSFKIKRFPDGTVKNFKVQFCARRDHQKEGIDLFETWAPVVQWSTIKIVMVLAVNSGLQLVQCNITAAFIHGLVPLEEEIYVHQPRGFK